MRAMIFLVMLTVSAIVNAGTTITSKVQYVQANPGGGTSNIVAIKFETPATALADCASDNRMIADLNTEGGKAALSIALAAKVAKLTVQVGGNGDCTGSIENIAYIRLL